MLTTLTAVGDGGEGSDKEEECSQGHHEEGDAHGVLLGVELNRHVAPRLVVGFVHQGCRVFRVWSLTIFYSVHSSDRCEKVRFQQTHNQGLRQLFLTVSWDLLA